MPNIHWIGNQVSLVAHLLLVWPTDTARQVGAATFGFGIVLIFLSIITILVDVSGTLASS